VRCVTPGLRRGGLAASAERRRVLRTPLLDAAQVFAVPGRLLASEAIVQRAGAQESRRWQVGEAVVLRGRSCPTPAASPVA
jgi:hypothetical protein